MTKETCTTCNRTFETYNLNDGKCRICLRKESNAHDLDMLTDEEYEQIMGKPRQGRSPAKKQHKRKKQEPTKQEILNQVNELSDEDFAELLKQLA